MKTKTLLWGAWLAIGLLAVSANAQMQVVTVVSSGLSEPYNAVLDIYNYMYISDCANKRIIRIDPSTQVASTLVGVEGESGSNDGPAYGFVPAHFSNPQGLLILNIVSTNPLPATVIDGMTVATNVVITNMVVGIITNYFTNYFIVTNFFANGLLVSDSSSANSDNNAIRFVRFSDGYVTTLAGQTSSGSTDNAVGTSATFSTPIGLTQDGNGNIYIADSRNNTIRVMSMNDPAFGVTTLVIPGVTLYRPVAVAFAGTNQLWVADAGTTQAGSDNTIRLFTLTTPTTGTLTTYMGGNSTGISPGMVNNPFGPSARFNQPMGLLWLEGTGLLISDTANNLIRIATNYTVYGATNYAVSTFAGTNVTTGQIVNGPLLSAEFNAPCGISQDLGNNGFLIADRANNAIRRIQVGPALPPVPTPRIGWVEYPFPYYLTLLHADQPFIFNNDEDIAIQGVMGTETHYTYGTTPTDPLNDTIPNPTSTFGFTPPPYADGLPSITPLPIVKQPDFTIKAIGTQSHRQNSAIAIARFQFKVANPVVLGNNAAGFSVTNITRGVQMWWTTNGVDPTNVLSSTNYGPKLPGDKIGFTITTNVTFKIRGFTNGYAPSDVVSVVFTPANFVPNSISFGFGTGEASSDFVASPGQFFYAPVTLSPLAGQDVYSLQFNLTVTNLGSAPPVPSDYYFQSMLMKPIPDTKPVLYEVIPPAMYLPYATNWNILTNWWWFFGPIMNPPPTNKIIYPYVEYFFLVPFMDLQFVDSSINLMGVGWLERYGMANLYETTKQDLITYSRPHDTLFIKNGGKVVLGGYGFRVPPNATPGQAYQIQIGRPSATSDGIGAPGSGVSIFTPTNGSLGSGLMNSIKYVTVGQRKYIAGDSAPFRWFNAGDFGNTNLDNSDVMQVFQSAVYELDNPPRGSDFFDSMDSCGATYLDLGHGYLEKNTMITDTNALNALFDGNDTTINQIAFGDGILDVCDIYVTFRRSLDPSLTWFRRFRTNDVLHGVFDLVAETTPNLFNPNVVSHSAAVVRKTESAGGANSITNQPKVDFSSGDFVAAAGDVIQVPIMAKIFGSYPMRKLMLNLSVIPLAGSPALTTPVQFSYNPALGSPWATDQRGDGNYSAAWLSGSGLTGDVTIGILTVTVPTNATSLSAYAIHFDHASASPNGLASFPKQMINGLITLSSRTNSSYGDNIPDSWRLRYFLTVNNLLSQADADADGDGVNNWREYLAGTDPTDPKSVFKNIAAAHAAAHANHESVISWPSVNGKQYVIERALSLTSLNWIPVSTNIGTGTTMEFHDASGGNVRFYRVHVR